MTPERWQQVKGVLDGALSLEPAQRGAYLDGACAGDAAFRREVESLLAAGQEGRSSFLQSPPIVQLTPGTRLGDYEIQSLIGAGGMGEVYRARDLRLRREVAIKVLSALLASDAERMRRFEQEAMAAAALNHPNILAVFQMGTQDGTPYLVSELLEGETLREQIRRGRIGMRRVIDYGVQIAHGLAAAHEKGIVHRDLKPENLFVTRDGRLKILDFGLAKLTQPQAGSKHSIPTLGGETEPGVIMGTVGYMSPEQVKGQTADHRADIFAFGTILYEMLTSKRAYRKPTTPETMVAILNEDAAPIPGVAVSMQRIVQRCLEKNPEQRFQSASDLGFALSALTEAGEAVAPPSAKKSWKIAALGRVLLVAVLVGWVYYLRWRPSRHLSETDTIVLADFANSTGDAVFDDTLKTALDVSLRQSPFLNVLPESKVAKTLQMMTRPVDTKLTPEIAREVCERAGSKAYIAGAIAGLGSEYVLGLKAVNCQTGDVLAQGQVTAAAKERVLDALGSAASKLRGELGESLATVQKFDVPLEQATTSSLEALKAYSLGQKIRTERGSVAALPYHQRAIELDPKFATGYKALGEDYFNLGQVGRARGHYTQAFHWRERASERERLSITADYYSYATGELDKAAQTHREEIETYPRSAEAYYLLGDVFASEGQYEKAADLTRQALRLAPDANWYSVLGTWTMALQRLEEARQLSRAQQARKLDDYGLHNNLYALAFLAGDSAAMAEQQQWYAGNAQYENFGFALASQTEAYVGRLSKARELTKRAVDSAAQADNKENAALWQADSALREAAYGNAAAARRMAAEALKLHPASQGVEIEVALAFAKAGDTTRAESVAKDLSNRYPLDTQTQSLWLPTIHAQLSLDRKYPDSALSTLHSVEPIELANVITTPVGISCLYPVYVRGEAYLAAGKGHAAAAEFQKILDHSGIVWNCWTGALAHLGVARANAWQSTTSRGSDAEAARVRALAAYEDFLNLWKNADPDIPIYKQAKAEYAKLQQPVPRQNCAVHRQNQECANWVSRRLLSEDGNWPESVRSHCFRPRAARSFESGTRKAHETIRPAQIRPIAESSLFSKS